MKLNIENFAKIKNANIDFDGITVIAGENDTGKSTVGKVLFSVFTSFKCLDERVNNEVVASLAKELFAMTDITNFSELKKLENLSKKLINLEKYDYQNIFDCLREASIINKKTINCEKIDSLLQIINFNRNRLENLIISRIFSDEFRKQYHYLLSTEQPIKISLVVHHETFKLEIYQNNFISENPFELNKNCVLIDDPFILDRLNFRNYNNSFLNRFLDGDDSNDHFSYLLKVLSSNKKSGSLIEQDILDNRIRKYLKLIKKEVKGDFILKNEKLMFHVDQDFDLELPNLSTGIKSFAILLKLLEDNEIQEKSMIILDEPEVHLHPKWQILYAELLVLLQKEFDLNILITTHSPYFLNAIQVFSKKHDISEKCNYYNSYLDDNEKACFENVNSNLDIIYKKLAEPFNDLQYIEENIDE